MNSTGLTGVKAGDEVVVTNATHLGAQVLRVERVDRRHAVIGGRQFDLSDGLVSDRYDVTCSCAYTILQWARCKLEENLDAAIRAVGAARSFAHLSDDDMRELTQVLLCVAQRLGDEK